jgi:predicted AlkP superfamily pyrophosphatase or phosphodiesterase
MDEIIKPLMFSFVASKKRNTLKKTGVSAKEIYPTENFSENFIKKGIKVYSFLNKSYLKTPYNTVVSNGMKLITYKNWSDELNKLQKKIIDKEKAYYFVYNEYFDNTEHEFGPDSKEAEVEIKNVFNGLEKFLSII